MKQIKLNCVSKRPDGSYSIFFHSNLRYSFSNLREAENFQRTLNKYLTEYANIINHSLIEVYTLYRKLWPLLKFRESSQIRSSIFSIEETLKKAYLASQRPTNGSAFVYSHFSYCFDEFNTTLSTIETLCKSKKYYFLVREIRAIRRNLVYSWDEFEKFNVKDTLERDKLEQQTVKLNVS